jgi:hypothetical protein
MMFANPYLRRIQVDWELQAREFLAMFRADYDSLVAERERYDNPVRAARESLSANLPTLVCAKPRDNVACAARFVS